jgi:hypothetical protein
MIDWARSSDPLAVALLRQHPNVRQAELGTKPGIEFGIGTWNRSIRIGANELYGITEFMDNNPMVCADTIGLPSPSVHLALLALSPIIDSGLVVDSPALVISEEIDEDELSFGLAQCGWTQGCAVAVEPMPLNGVIAATAIVAIRTPSHPAEIDEIYEERFGRSFYVRPSSEAWTSDSVRGTQFARYRTSLALETGTSLLTIKAMADAQGKLGPAGWIHAMNVMANLEESVGIPVRLSG